MLFQRLPNFSRFSKDATSARWLKAMQCLERQCLGFAGDGSLCGSRPRGVAGKMPRLLF